MLVAVKELTAAFEKDVQSVLKAPISLGSLEKEARVLIVVDAVNLLKNFLVQTFTADKK